MIDPERLIKKREYGKDSYFVASLSTKVIRIIALAV